ncbi:MAG TPA: hypothetical protein VKA70_03890 [Blastocatellia bacterium]|nr:hypothetical protein [Blastocatellia bacterium]
MQEPQKESFLRAYAQSVLQRLYGQGFRCAENVPYGGQVFSAVGHKGGFELSKFGMFERFFVLQYLSSIDPMSLGRFSAHCYNYATSAKESPLPLGFFASLVCYSVAIVDTVDQATAISITNETPPKHLGSFEFPVIYELGTRRLYYLDRTPLWGAAYFNGFKNEAHMMLSF